MRAPMILALLLSACASPGGSAAPDAPGMQDDIPDAAWAFGVEGVVRPAGPEHGTLVVLWQVSSGSPDHVYKFGDGTSTTTSFRLWFLSAPPPDAINSYGIAVGVVVLMAPDAEIPRDGILTMDPDDLAIAGLAPQHAIVYRATEATPLSWIAPFPQGFACGRCVHLPDGFDAFEPVPCSAVDVIVDATTDDVCEWT